MIEKKKVLLLAYHFPPDTSVGALRPQKFAKYLPEFGWKPYVLTIKEHFIAKQDPQLLEDVRESIIVRTDFWRTPLQIFLDWRARLKEENKKDFTKPDVTTSESIFGVHRNNVMWRRCKHFIFLFNYFPDEKLFWLIPAIWSGFRLIKREKISTIFATAPPHSVAIIGLLLSLFTGARLVIDFRDPWVLWHRSIFNAPGDRFFVILESLLERFVVKRAKLVISTTARLTNELRHQYANKQNSKFTTITNGFDSDDFIETGSVPSLGGKYCICYVGTFYLDRTPEAFFSALQRALSDEIITKDTIEVKLIGDVAFACGKPIQKMVSDYGLEECVTVLEPVPYREALRYISSADLLLLLAPNFKYQIPAKTFEYIGAKRPILALTEEEGATADLIRSVNAGLVAHQNNKDQIYEALKVFILQASSSTQTWYNGVDVTMFARKRLTQQLSDILLGI